MYLDDFLLIGSPGTDEGLRALTATLNTLNYLGVPVAEHKTEGPCCALGHPDRYNNIRAQTCSGKTRWMTKKVCTRRERESLLGHLAHAAIVVRPERTFLRHLFSWLGMARSANHFNSLNTVVKADLAWWRCFCASWSGCSFFPLPTPSAHVFSDASGSYSCGAVAEPLGWLGWFYFQWPESWVAVDIAAKELVPIVFAAALWGERWRSRNVCFHSDNMAVVAILTSRTAGTPLLMHLLRYFSFYSAYYCFNYTCVHIPWVMNVAADALSRNNLPLFFSLVPQVPQFTIPAILVEFLVTSRPDWGSNAWTQLFTNSLDSEFRRIHTRHTPQERRGT